MLIRNHVHVALSGSSANKLARRVSVTLIALILLNVLAVMAESVESLRVEYGAWLTGFEVASVAVFSLEYLLRLWSCTSSPRFKHPIVGRVRYIFTPLAIIDLLAILPALLMWTGVDLRVLRILRLTRLLRLAKLGRYSKALQLMGEVARQKREELVLSLMLMLLMLVVASSLMYLVENEQQPEVFSSIPASMWWGITTLTTVGYGDAYPITILGKLLGAAIAVMGIGLFALPAGIIASAFVELRGQQNVAKVGACPHCGNPLEEQTRRDKANRE